MRSILSTLALALFAASPALAQQTSDPRTQAQEILKRARAVIWDETKSKPLQSISINAIRRFARGERQVEVDMTLEALLPDKFLQTDTYTLSVGSDFTSIRAINGSQALSNFESNMEALVDMKKSMARANGSTETGGDKGISGKKMGGGLGAKLGELGGIGGAGSGSADQSNQESHIREGFARLLLVWLGATPSSLPVEFTYGGQAIAQVGAKSADVIDVTGPGNFAARLFINPQTHQVMMLTYKARKPGKQPQESQAPESEAESRWVLSDYRNVGGLNLPHQLVIFLDGRPVEEVSVKKVKINPSIKPDRFEKKK